MPEGYKSGRIHLLHLGVFFTLDRHIATGFSGLHLHVGTPPVAPGDTVAPDAFRLRLFHYPNNSAYPEKGNTRLSLSRG